MQFAVPITFGSTLEIFTQKKWNGKIDQVLNEIKQRRKRHPHTLLKLEEPPKMIRPELLKESGVKEVL